VGADPDVHKTAHGMEVLLLNPNAINAADRSSKIGVQFIFGCFSKPRTKGVEREPGEKKTCDIPDSNKVSATIFPHATFACAIDSESWFIKKGSYCFP